MKKSLSLLLVLLLAQAVPAQDLTMVSTSPENGAVAVEIEASIRLEFSAPVDTSAVDTLDLPISTFISPRDSIFVRGVFTNEQASEISIEVTHTRETDFTWIVTGARGEDGAILDEPYVLRYTVASEWGERTESGEVVLLVPTGRGDVAGDDVAEVVLEFASGGSSEIPSTPTILHMDQSYPKPSVGLTAVEFELDRPGTISLSVFNVMGQEVLTVMNGEHLIHGPHRTSWNASSLASGAYICRLKVDQSSSSRVIFVRR